MQVSVVSHSSHCVEGHIVKVEFNFISQNEHLLHAYCVPGTPIGLLF